MKKIIGLLLLAAVLVGAVVGLMSIISPGTDDGPTISDNLTAEAKEWKEKIDSLCDDGKWSIDGYNSIETGIHTDRVTSDGELISVDEENALQKYLFASSCSCLKKQVFDLFKLSSYPQAKVKSSDDMLAFLKSEQADFARNSNLTQASDILSEYHQLIGLLSFSSNASYSNPLRAFKAASADAFRSRVKGMKYYSSHFSKNPSIRNQVDNYASNRARAEREYYSNLEKCIENHYKSTSSKSILLEDQDQFDRISTNSDATNRLENFITNPQR